MSKEVTMSQPSYGTPGSSGDAPSPSTPPTPSTPSTPPTPPAGAPGWDGPAAPQYPAPHDPAPQYCAPQPQQWSGSPGPQGSLSAQDERNWAMGAHLSSFVAAWVALGVLGPLTVLLVSGNRSAFVRRHAVEALNWNISALIYIAVCIPLMFILIGIPMAIVVGVCYVIFTIMGAIAANRGEEFRYPLTIRFVK